MNTTEFNEIRSYYDEEVPQIVSELLADPAFLRVAAKAFPDVPFDLLVEKIGECKNRRAFQVLVPYRWLKGMAAKRTDGLTLDHSALTDKEVAYTYISNHRDIVLDSGFLSILLIDQGMETVEIAIGDNLLIYPWIKKLVRLNKSFIVQRALPMRQMLESSARMSRYIHYTIGEKKQSVWIAQREGRAKDSNDRTQESVVKMLAMGGEGNLLDRLMELNIAPLAISYEYDPCDYLKAQEFQLKRDVEGYKKTTQDDLMNMQTGLLGYKGRVHFQVASCLNDELAKLDRTLPKTELYKQIVELIDTQIYLNYRLYPGNYIACDLLDGNDTFAPHYSREEKEHFQQYLKGQVDLIDIENKDTDYLYDKLLQMYANPARNKVKSEK